MNLRSVRTFLKLLWKHFNLEVIMTQQVGEKIQDSDFGGCGGLNKDGI